MLVPT